MSYSPTLNLGWWDEKAGPKLCIRVCVLFVGLAITFFGNIGRHNSLTLQEEDKTSALVPDQEEDKTSALVPDQEEDKTSALGPDQVRVSFNLSMLFDQLHLDD